MVERGTFLERVPIALDAGPVRSGSSRVSPRADVAHFMLGELTTRAYVREAVRSATEEVFAPYQPVEPGGVLQVKVE